MDNADVVWRFQLASGCSGSCTPHEVEPVREDELRSWSVSTRAGHCYVSCVDHTVGANGHNHGEYLVLLVMAAVVACEDTVGGNERASAHSTWSFLEQKLQEGIVAILQGNSVSSY